MALSTTGPPSSHLARILTLGFQVMLSVDGTSKTLTIRAGWLCQGHRFQGKRFRFVTELYEHVFSEHWDKGEVFRNNPRYYPRCDQCCEYVHDSSCAHPRDFQCHHQGFFNVSSTLADEPFATLGEVMVHYTAFHPPEIAGQAHWMYVNRDTWPPPDIHDE